MGVAIEVVTVQVTAPGAVLVTASAVTGNSLVVRDSRASINIIAAWSQRQTAGQFRVISPLMHDNVIGNTWNAAGGSTSHVPPGWRQPVRGQDNMSALISGSATAGDIELSSLLLRYDDLPGVEGKFIGGDELAKRGVNTYSCVSTVTNGTTGGYSGSESISADMDALKANTEYAIVGAYSNSTFCTIRYTSPDWGNLGVGLPATANRPERTSQHFLELSRQLGMPCIPVFNSSNKSLTLIDIAADENASARAITTLLVELSSKR